MTNPDSSRRVTLSLAVFVLICFFLPWVQLSCVGIKDSLSGFDLARAGDTLLWLVPVLMLVIILIGLWRSLEQKLPSFFALASTVGGGISAYLMYNERSTTNQSPRLVLAQWTSLFWLGFAASLGIVAAAIVYYARRSRSP
jgi:hypothetical protein